MRNICILPVSILIIGTVGIWLFRQRLCRWGNTPNILLISIDTCRADYLGCYGCTRQTTPNIDAVAAEGIVFADAFSPVPLTLPAHSSMLTGTIPPYHKVHNNVGYCLGNSNLTLAEILKTQGYRTGAVIAEFILDSQLGTAQGFDTYNDNFPGQREPDFSHERRAEETSSLAEQWLEKYADESFFLFLHYFDPHQQYIPPEPFASDFADNPYAGEIAYTDHCIGKVMDKLKNLGLYDSTLIIITGDHGESFGEHGEYTHGHFIYNSTLKVPLIFKVPKNSIAKKIKQPASLIDIVPTVLGYLGITVPPQVQGKDLSACFGSTGVKPQTRYIYCESLCATSLGCSPLRGIVSNNFKYIHTTRPELYNLVDDPAETVNLIAKAPERAELLKNHLEGLLNQSNQADENSSRFTADQESLNRLRSLGYLGAQINESRRLDANMDDPKDFVDLSNKIVEMLNLWNNNKNQQAKLACQQILRQRPGLGMIHSVLAQLFEQLGDNEEAIRHFRLALNSKYAGKADKVMHYCNLANALVKQGQTEEAISLYTEALRIDPDCAEAHCHLATALAKQGNTTEALKHFFEAVRINPCYSMAHYYLAETLAGLGRTEEAVEHLRKVTMLNPDFAEAHYHLANTLATMGKTDPAIREYRQTLRLDPAQPEPANELAWILATHKNADSDTSEAIKLAETACEQTNYSNPYFLNTLAITYFAAGKTSEAVRTAEKALELAHSTGQEGLAAEIKKRLKSYKQTQPPR